MLQRMEVAVVGHAFDRLDAFAFGLRRQHEAGTDEAAVDHDGAGAAIAGAAAFLGAREAELVAQGVEQRLAAAAEELDGLAVDGGGDADAAHASARSLAMVAARRARTLAILVRYSAVPRLSLIGLAAAATAASIFAKAASSSFEPMRAAPAASTRSVVGATAPRPTRAAVHRAGGVEREADAAADDGDVHLGARDQAEVGVGRSAPGARGVGRRAGFHPARSVVLPGLAWIFSTGSSRRAAGRRR